MVFVSYISISISLLSFPLPLQYAGNVLAFPVGDWFGYVTPANVEPLLQYILSEHNNPTNIHATMRTNTKDNTTTTNSNNNNNTNPSNVGVSNISNITPHNNNQLFYSMENLLLKLGLSLKQTLKVSENFLGKSSYRLYLYDVIY